MVNACAFFKDLSPESDLIFGNKVRSLVSNYFFYGAEVSKFLNIFLIIIIIRWPFSVETCYSEVRHCKWEKSSEKNIF